MQTLFKLIQIESHNTLNHKTLPFLGWTVDYIFFNSVIWLILGLVRLAKTIWCLQYVSRQHKTISNWLHNWPIKLLLKHTLSNLRFQKCSRNIVKPGEEWQQWIKRKSQNTLSIISTLNRKCQNRTDCDEFTHIQYAYLHDQ